MFCIRACIPVSYTHLALGENVVEICREACKAAKAHGVKIRCDLNYRGKLWTREQARSLSSPHTQSVRPLSTACAVTALTPA